jgi:hypothetical protein
MMEAVPRHWKGDEDMTKARARERAKAKAGQKTKKRDATATQNDQNNRPEQFDSGAGSITKPQVSSAAKNFGRGASRSR